MAHLKDVEDPVLAVQSQKNQNYWDQHHQGHQVGSLHLVPKPPVTLSEGFHTEQSSNQILDQSL